MKRFIYDIKFSWIIVVLNLPNSAFVVFMEAFLFRP